MTISLTRVMNAINKPKIAKYWIGYFRENFRGEINDKLLEAFHTGDITKADIARKLDRRPEQITRWLSAPCNLEVDTISDIALSLGLIPEIRFEKISEDRSNSRTHDFVGRFEKFTVMANTRKRTFVYGQSTYDTTTLRLSASTDQNIPDIFSSEVPNKAYVREVMLNA